MVPHFTYNDTEWAKIEGKRGLMFVLKPYLKKMRRISISKQMVMMMLTMMMVVMVMIELETNIGPMSWWESVLSPQSVIGFFTGQCQLRVGPLGSQSLMASEEEIPALFTYKKSLCEDNHHVQRKWEEWLKVGMLWWCWWCSWWLRWRWWTETGAPV